MTVPPSFTHSFHSHPHDAHPFTRRAKWHICDPLRPRPFSSPCVFSSFQSCSECPEPTLAQSLCTLCNKWLCYQCTDVHQHHRVAAAAAASQCSDVHAVHRPGSEQHQKGCSSLPVTGQGKTFVDAGVLQSPEKSGLDSPPPPPRSLFAC